MGKKTILSLVLLLVLAAAAVLFFRGRLGGIEDSLPTAQELAKSAAQGVKKAGEAALSYAPEGLGETISEAVNATVEVLEGSSADRAEPEEPPLTPVTPDPSMIHELVTPAFVADLATHAVSAYFPKTTHPLAEADGITTLSLKRLNKRYGIELAGFNTGELGASGNIPGARRLVLRAAFSPLALRLLYDYYDEPFVAAFTTAAEGAERTFPRVGKAPLTRPLSMGEVKESMRLTALWLRGLARTLDGLAKMRDFSASVGGYMDAVTATSEANAAFSTALAEAEAVKDQSAQTEADEAAYQAAKAKAETAGDVYQTAIRTREQARLALISEIYATMGLTPEGRPKENPGLVAFSEGDAAVIPPSECLFAAAWAHRRMVELGSYEPVKAALEEGSLLLANLAGRLEGAARRYGE